jgi:uncharacterized membrane protein (UPF0127 family)
MPMTGLVTRFGPEHRPGRFVGGIILTLLMACSSSQGQASQGERGPEPPGDSTAPGMQERLPPPGEAWVIFGTDTIGVELARTAAEREEGLMNRETLEAGRGMLFVFSDAQYRSFWMKNTFIPLDIAYIDENLRITDIQAMEPETENEHPSARPAMFALEVPLGWFAAKGIEAGDQAKLVFGPG